MTSSATDVITPYITGERSIAKYTGGREYPTRDEIAQRAYRRYEIRGREDGYDIEDWLLAEKELRNHYA